MKRALYVTVIGVLIAGLGLVALQQKLVLGPVRLGGEDHCMELRGRVLAG